MNTNQEFYPDALRIAEALYAHKTRSGSGIPYITHPMMLVDTLRSHGHGGDLLLCGALLHDAIEENDHSQEIITSLQKDCPPELFALIEEVTDAPGLGREERRAEQAERAAGYSTKARLIRLADKLANMTDILERPQKLAPRHIVSYCEFAMKIVAICRDADPSLGLACDATFAKFLAAYGTSKGRDRGDIDQIPR